jgi:hypothetical protein
MLGQVRVDCLTRNKVLQQLLDIDAVPFEPSTRLCSILATDLVRGETMIEGFDFLVEQPFPGRRESTFQKTEIHLVRELTKTRPGLGVSIRPAFFEIIPESRHVVLIHHSHHL